MSQDILATWLYTRIGTFMTRLMLLAPVGPRLLEDRMAEAFARQVPITSSYESFSERPRNVGGRFEGSVSEYVSTTI